MPPENPAADHALARLGRHARPFLALLALWLLFELPTAVRSHGFDLRRIRPTGDFLVLLSVYALARGRPSFSVVRRVWMVCLGVLIAVRLDWTLCWFMTRSSPLLYDQLFLLRHLFLLVGDLWTVPTALALVVLGFASYGIVLLARALVRTTEPAFAPPLRRNLSIALGVAGCVLLILTVALTPARGKEPYVRWLFPELVENVRESYRTYRAVRRGVADSTYRSYAGITLKRRPNVTFLFVESYGKITVDNPELARRLSPRLLEMQQRLTDDGWHMVSGFSTAPVSGGRSWLAVGSIFMGKSVPYESAFHHLVEDVPALPTIPSFFARRGYRIIALEPSVHPRPGLAEPNYYRADTQIYFENLGYTGRLMGWGKVPDQYSLGFADEYVLSVSKGPRFLWFHMVSSHLPWGVVPRLVDDWRTLNDSHITPIDEAHGSVELGGLAAGYRERYVDTVAYDLSVIERHLLRERADELVVVMGDHQPPLVTQDSENFDVPVHLFARDPALIAEFADRGFVPGLLLQAKTPPALEHAGFFSLLVRALVRVQPGGAAAPPYLRSGVPLTG